MIELSELEKEFMEKIKIMWGNNWFLPTNQNSNSYDLAEALLEKGKLERLTKPFSNPGSGSIYFKHYFRINEDVQKKS